MVAGQVLAMKLPIFEIVIFLAEHIPKIIAVMVVLCCTVRKPLIKYVLLAPVLVFFGIIGFVFYESRTNAALEGYDMSLPPMRVALEKYIETGEGDMNFIIEGGKHPPVFGEYEIKRYLGTWFAGSALHDTTQDASYLPEAYNKGDDWFEATLGEPMVYTGAIYLSDDDSMWESQNRKLDYIANAIGVKKGDNAMDIGCGWGRLSNHLASKGAKVTGVTMSSDQQAYAKRMNKAEGSNVNIVLQNFFEVDFKPKSFNVISSVEMAEHVGIRNYNKFLRKVHSLLADDGTFYLQVAGLPRGYGEGYNHYEDLLWGLFMDEHVFPGADASCPLGWVTTHLERAGFEVQAVQNLGNHYSKTLYSWQLVWESKKDEISKAYGERAWRRWRVFLAWSVRVARRGGSTVNFITATKSGNEAARIGAQDRLAPGNPVLNSLGAGYTTGPSGHKD
jgi:cyclopropane fatty-acyl-phospholipid synthase-like methyltransferase